MLCKVGELRAAAHRGAETAYEAKLLELQGDGGTGTGGVAVVGGRAPKRKRNTVGWVEPTNVAELKAAKKEWIRRTALG